VSGAAPEPPQVTATVSPAPPPRSRWGAIPHHLGRARTSTVVLSLLFLAVGALWLNIRPDPDVPATTGGGTVVDEPAAPTTAVPTTPAPTTDPVPTTAEVPTTTEPVPTTSSPEVPAPTETGTDSPTTTTTTEPPTPLPGTTRLPGTTSTPTG
jgi:hypothetical protein